jgi:hypothetical protein
MLSTVDMCDEAVPTGFCLRTNCNKKQIVAYYTETVEFGEAVGKVWSNEQNLYFYSNKR